MDPCLARPELVEMPLQPLRERRGGGEQKHHCRSQYDARRNIAGIMEPQSGAANAGGDKGPDIRERTRQTPFQEDHGGEGEIKRGGVAGERVDAVPLAEIDTIRLIEMKRRIE